MGEFSQEEEKSKKLFAQCSFAEMTTLTGVTDKLDV
jgi:hypothetical protein